MVYFCTLGIGVYFIYKGEVVQRFQRRRTNFAHYEEQVSELPIHTISVWTKNKTFKFGEDYHLQFRQGAQGSFHTAINLTYGDNRIPENNLRLTIDSELENQRSLKISFANLSSKMPLDYQFIFKHVNSNSVTQHSKPLVKAYVKTKNGSMRCNGKYNDGDSSAAIFPWGTLTTFRLFTEKKILIQDSNNCRLEPYTEQINEKFLQNVKKECHQPCRHPQYLTICKGLFLSKEIRKYPICSNANETECFDYVFSKTVSEVQEQACTKLDFKLTTGWKLIHGLQKSAILQILFDPAKVTVKEEYLIYDLVATISAIGGTMGLCIGFSFTEYMSELLRFVEHITSRMAGKNGIDEQNKGPLFVKPVHSTEETVLKEISIDIAKLKSKMDRYDTRILALETNK